MSNLSLIEEEGKDEFATLSCTSSVSSVYPKHCANKPEIHSDGSYILETETDPLCNINTNVTPNHVPNGLPNGTPNNTPNDAPNNMENTRDIMIFSKLKLLQRVHDELMNPTERKSLYLSILFIIIGGILRLIFFSFIGSIIDLLANTYDYDDPTGQHVICSFHKFINCSSNESLITVFIVTLVILSIISSLSKLTQSLLTTLCCNSISQRLNYLAFDAIISADLSFFDRRQNRDLRSMLTVDMKHIRKTLYSTENIIESVIYFICCIMYLFVVNWDIGLMVIGSFLLSSFISKIYHQKDVRVYVIMTNSFKVSVITLTEMLKYITTIKTFDKEDDEQFLFQQCVNRAFKFDKKRKILLYCYSFWIAIITYFTILCVVWYGTVAAHISVGQVTINLFVLLQFNYCIYQTIKWSNKTYPECVRRIMNIIDTKQNEKEEKTESRNNNAIPSNDDEDIEGLIEMRNIEFSYPSSRKLVLNNVSLSFNASSITALVGMSPSGKASILQLIMKLYSPQKGQIFIGNMDITKYNLDFLQSHIGYIGYIGKDIHLFENRTIADNITFGIKLHKRYYNRLKQKDIENAAKIANIHEFIMNLEKGYDTVIGGCNGVKLNEGEKQRIGIARTILLKPKILLLDEAMSHLDSTSKYLIQESLDKIVDGRCVIVIAHRLKTIKRANKIYVIHNGKIVESGNHHELMQRTDGQYFKLHQREIFN